ncbi:MAG: hypothetical protein IMX01_05595 [Limnochordaceae bacterium]|nr:hypothetical protein [Limnochordaceae bacterium]
MKRGIAEWMSLGLAVALVAGVGGVAAAANWIATPATGPIAIDGNAQDWNLDQLPPEAAIVLSPSTSTVEGAIASDDEASGKVYVKYDDQAVYVLGVMKDDNVVGDATGGGIYQNTCIELWFNLGDQTLPAEPGDYGNYGAEDYQINLTPKVGGEDKAYYYVFPGSKAEYNDNGSIDVAAQLVPGGYVIEARIPKDKFPGMAGITKGARFGFAVSLVHVGQNGSWNHMWAIAREYDPVVVQ